MDNPRDASQLSPHETGSPPTEAASSRDRFSHRPPPISPPPRNEESSTRPNSRDSCPLDSPVFRRLPSVCDQHLMTESLLETSTSTGDRHWTRDSRSSSWEPEEGGNGFAPRPSSVFSRVSSEGSNTTLPEWPELDPAAFERGKELLGGMELDPSCYSRDDLCHLALEIFEAAGSQPQIPTPKPLTPIPNQQTTNNKQQTTLEAAQGQMDGFFSQLPYKCHQNRVASVGD